MMNRRRFLQGMASTSGVLWLDPRLSELAKSSEPPIPNKIGVLQGPTNETSSVIVVVAPKNAVLRFRIEGDSTADVRTVDLGLGDFVVHHLRFSDLELGRTYDLRITDEHGLIQERRFFRALDWNHADPKIAVLSCANHKKANPQRVMCQRMGEAAPDVVFFIGDLVYANSGFDTLRGAAADPVDAFVRYVRTFQTIDLYQCETLTPTFYIWDDHDIGKNNADSTHPHLEEMGRIFRAFFPMDEGWKGLSLGPGMSFAMEAFGMHIVVPDQRTFVRKGTDMLGAEQLRWFLGHVSNSTKPLLLLMPQLTWTYHSWGESYQKKAPDELNTVLTALRRAGRPCLFFSGDIHYSQIQEIDPSQIGFKTYEITSSAFFSRSSGPLGRRKPKDGQLEYYGDPNFILVDQIRAAADSLSVRVTCLSEKSNRQFVRDLAVSVRPAIQLQPMGGIIDADASLIGG